MSEPHSKSQPIFKIWCFILGLALLLTGLFYLIGGGKLISLGGSWYFFIAGLLTTASAIFVFRKKAFGVWLFALVFVGTLVWAWFDAGWDFWALFSRLMFPAGVFAALLFTLPAIRRYQTQSSLVAPAYTGATVVVIGMLIAFYQMFQPHPTVAASGQELPLIPVDADKQQVNWQHYGNDTGGSRFAALDQINRNNVKDLKEVWRFQTGDLTTGSGNGAEDQTTPLQVGDKVFVCTPHNNIIALDTDSGKQIWKAEVNSKADAWERCRGVAYFDVTQPLVQPTLAGATPVTTVAANTACPRRVYTNTPDGRLIAVNADTGERCKDFGVDGTVDLLVGLGDGTKAPRFEVTSAPTIAGTTLVIGSRIADNVAADMPGGVIRAYDVITGKLRWAFDPRNPDPNYVLKAGEIYKRSSANSWAAMSYDPQMNTVFLPMGSSSVDVWGGNRQPVDHKYNSSVLALDATTGKEKWVYQTVHNDLWDFDLPMQPSLVDFPMKDGTTKPAVVIGTKSGQFFVLDRLTGKPLTKVVEQPVKAADIPDEQYSATQPRSVEMPQIGNQTLTESGDAI